MKNTYGKNLPFKTQINNVLKIILFMLVFIIPDMVKASRQVDDTGITLSGKNITLMEIIQNIEQQTNYLCLFSSNDLNLKRKFSLEVKGVTVEVLLNDLFQNSPISYKIQGKQIILFKDKKKKKVENIAPLPQNMGVNEISITGQILDETGVPMPGVSVTIKGSKKGMVSDINGKFTIQVPDQGTILVFSFIGYKKKEVIVGSQTTINVKMEPDAIALEQVVAIGYGTVKKSDLTSSMSSLRKEDMVSEGSVTSPEEMMKGRVSGMQITPNSGEPGSGMSIVIRGASAIQTGQQPLFVIDGVPLQAGSPEPSSGTMGIESSSSNSSPFRYINPSDIQSIDVLKGASATAIYGSRGANGVVLITTKKGEQGKTIIEYSSSFNISELPKKLNMLSASEFVQQRRKFGVTDTTSEYGANTNWQDQIFRTAVGQKHDLSFSGGTKSGSYFGSVGYQNQEGIIKKSDMDKYNARLNIYQKLLNDKLTIEGNMAASYIKQNTVPIGEASKTGDMLFYALESNPTMPVKSDTGGYFQLPGIATQNPVAMLNYLTNQSKSTRIIGNFTPSYEIIKGLTYKLNIGIDHADATRQQQEYSSYLPAVGKASALFNAQSSTNTTLDHTLNFDKTINKHHVTVLAGYSYEKYYVEGDGGYSWGMKNDDKINPIYNMSNGIATNMGTWTYSSKDEMQSFFGRVMYSFNSKYRLTATVRRDGSSKFGANNKYGTFPSLGGSWSILDEKFMESLKNSNVLNDLKIRVGWGQTGNANIGRGNSTWQYTSLPSATAILNGKTDSITKGMVLTQTPNPNLKWETSVQAEFGIDFALLKNRLTGSIDLFQKTTKNMLMSVPAKQPSPTETILINVDKGSIINKGLEISLGGYVLQKSDMSLFISGNFTTIKNTVQDLPVTSIPTGNASGSGMTNVAVERIANGQPMYVFYGAKFLGFDAKGNATYADANGNPAKDSASTAMFYLGNPNPKYIWGLSIKYTYKVFHLDIFIEGKHGQTIYNNTANSIDNLSNLTKQSLNVFESTVVSGDNGNNKTLFSSRYLENGGFVRLSDIKLSVDMPRAWIKGIKSATFFIKGNNLLLLTKYKGYDPEVNTNAGMNGVGSAGIDYSRYPKARIYTVGVDITL